ncbi:Sapep family Mn(2+)-dependent dipeptidase [Aminipila luticellarii]|uniref:M20 family peptidase n=1 Tax=Aminipila luticellarii TaxID=2507160 RepID=A0A410PTH2_9FIRM|nr:Sapep family Mn(2+)-dependent dipeptidase [Aminipila luticellarii]QAT42168.1 M20 family peptidase [Aminipila luticellarii]
MESYIKKDDMLLHLKELVSINSVSGPPEGKYPFGKGSFDALQYCLELCKKFGFQTKQCENYMGYAEIGQGDEIMGILVHLDVVPASSGWDCEPFDVTVKEDRVYGRGVIDDKGPAVAVIYAMKELLDSGKPLSRRIRLLFGCTEETGDWPDMEYYKQHEELPDFGFTPDADFPLIYAEKGILILQLKMKREESGIQNAKAGDAPNMVASHCEVTALGLDGREVTIVRDGKSAHGSMPWLGANAIGLVMKELPGRFAEFYNENFGQTWDGALLNCKLQDEQSGEITINPGMLISDEQWIKLVLDIRYPVSYTQEDIVNRITSKVANYGITAEILGGEKPVFMDKHSEFIQSLLKAYRDVTGDSTEPMTMGGGTYAKAMEHIVAFGPTFPGRECTEHQPNEYIFIEDLYKAREIYRLAMERACSVSV